jgi:hypothetical protein
MPMQVEFDLPMSAFDTPAVKAAFEHFIDKCQTEIAAGNTDYHVGYARRLQNLLVSLEKAESDAFASATRQPGS